MNKKKKEEKEITDKSKHCLQNHILVVFNI